MNASTSRVLICRRCTQPYALGVNDDLRLCPSCRSEPKTKREPKPMAEKRCPICATTFVQRSNEGPSDFARRTFCTKQCASKSRGARYDHVLRPRTAQKPAEPRTASSAPSRPRIATQPLCTPQQAHGTGLGVIPKKRKPWPQGDPALSVHAARPVDYRDGYALMAEINGHNSSSCQAMLRGWTASVAEHSIGLVFPRFERKETAALFDRMIDSRTGRRAA